MPRPPQHYSSCWIAALPLASQRNPLQRPRAPLEWTQLTSGTGCIAAQPATMHRPLHRSTGSCTQRHLLHRSVCAAQRSAAWYGSPLCARICVLGLRSSLTTGLGSSRPHLHRAKSTPTHICNWTEAIPCPPLPCERVRPPPTSAPQPSPCPGPHLCHHCCLPGQPPLRNTSVTQQRSTMYCIHMHCVATECHL